MKELELFINAVKDTYFDMLATCEINISKGNDIDYYKTVKGKINIKIMELDNLLKN